MLKSGDCVSRVQPRSREREQTQTTLLNGPIRLKKDRQKDKKERQAEKRRSYREKKTQRETERHRERKGRQKENHLVRLKREKERKG